MLFFDPEYKSAKPRFRRQHNAARINVSIHAFGRSRKAIVEMHRYSVFLIILAIYDWTNAFPEFQRCNDSVIRWTGSGSIEWPSPVAKNMFRSTGRYLPENAIASRVAVHKNDTFIAFPRYKMGVPVTLAKLSLRGRNCHVSIAPFPNWPMQEEANCAALQNVIDIYLDPYGILWVLDIGNVNYLQESASKCPPKVLGINAKSGKVVRTIEIGSLCNEITRLQYLVADYTRDGRAYVYVSDAANRAILVFDVTSSRGYRLILPKAVSQDCSSRDVLYLALVHPRRNPAQDRLIFSYLGSKHLFAIRTVHLQKGSARGKVEEIGIKDRFIFLGTDNKSSVFFRREDEPDVYVWNVLDASATVRKIYQGNRHALPTQLIADREGRVHLLESNFHDYFQGVYGQGALQTLKIIA